ncbi:MAG TPA: DNA polymerase III subunit gamma/tau [Patescibacteria group bacterium]
MVYYRKYRSQTIAQLDSPKLREILTSVLSSKDIPHAFLFTGPKGLGKTSTARIIAKVLNCTAKKRDGIEPCNECEQCKSITNGTNIDVLEIDGASNRGIDEIRELRERVNLAPSSAKRKVYIIDEVHMLTSEAFNALLKTIEEPPEHVVFIFCTTEPQKVPPTIISRCFHISLSRATEEEIVHSLKRIAEGEKITVSDAVLQQIAYMADGGFRDATKLFEELVLLANGKEITQELVDKSLNVSGISYLVSGISAKLEEKDAKGSFEIVEKLVEDGLDVKYFVSNLLEMLHNLLLIKVGVVRENAKDTKLSLEELEILVNLISEAYNQVKYSPFPQLPLEIAIVKWCSQDIEDKKEEIKNITEIKIKDDKPSMSDVIKKEKNLKVKEIINGPTPKPTIKPDDTTKQEVIHESANLLENIIYKVKPYNHSVAGVLRGCKIKSMDSERIVFETPYKFHKEKLDEAKTRDILEKGVKEITGKNLSVMIELKQ